MQTKHNPNKKARPCNSHKKKNSVDFAFSADHRVQMKKSEMREILIPC